MKDIYLHYPPVGRNVIPRDVRRRATAMVKQPFYFNRNNACLVFSFSCIAQE